MKIFNILHLLCCIEILGFLLCGAEIFQTTGEQDSEPTVNIFRALTTSASNISPSVDSSISPTSTVSNTAATSNIYENRSLTSSEPKVTTNGQSTSKHTVSNPPIKPTYPNTSTKPKNNYFKQECLEVLMVAGGLIILCAILLISTLSLTCKVCQLNRRINRLKKNKDDDLISNSGYLMGTAMKNKSKSGTEAVETTILMADINQTQEEVGNSVTKEEEKVIKDGQTEAEDNKASGDTAEASAGENKKETLEIGGENPSSPNPQEEAADSQSAKGVAASSSQATEEPKDVV